MIDDSEIEDISKIYKDMDTDGKKRMVQAAWKLLDGQLILRDNNSLLEMKRESTEFEIR